MKRSRASAFVGLGLLADQADQAALAVLVSSDIPAVATSSCVEDTSYVTKLGLSCADHSSLICTGFSELGLLDKDDTEELLRRCPVGCRLKECADQWKYGKQRENEDGDGDDNKKKNQLSSSIVALPLGAGIDATDRALGSCPDTWDDTCQDDPYYSSRIGAKCAFHSVVDCAGFEMIGYTEQEVFDLINGCPCSCGIECGTWTMSPTNKPSALPTAMHSYSPSDVPSNIPSISPSHVPSVHPSSAPSHYPSQHPSHEPSGSPTDLPSTYPSLLPTSIPSTSPSFLPSTLPSASPTHTPSTPPSDEPSALPSVSPTVSPSISPSESPSDRPSRLPSVEPSPMASDVPSFAPTVSQRPSVLPSDLPSERPSSAPSLSPIIVPVVGRPFEMSISPVGTYLDIKAYNVLNDEINKMVIGNLLLPDSLNSFSRSKLELSTVLTFQNLGSYRILESARDDGDYGDDADLVDGGTDVVSGVNERKLRSFKLRMFLQKTLHVSVPVLDAPRADGLIYDPNLIPDSEALDLAIEHLFQDRFQRMALMLRLKVSRVKALSSITDVEFHGFATRPPTDQPTTRPSSRPSAVPTHSPTVAPTFIPSRLPTISPTATPSSRPSSAPTQSPTLASSESPSASPSMQPSYVPSYRPSTHPSVDPTHAPSAKPSARPSVTASQAPSRNPTDRPSLSPTAYPTTMPSPYPTTSPSLHPTPHPTDRPSLSPTAYPTTMPSPYPTTSPSLHPTPHPTDRPSLSPTAYPTTMPSPYPTTSPTLHPTLHPTPSPSTRPSASPSVSPTNFPTRSPSTAPSARPSLSPTGKPKEIVAFGTSFDTYFDGVTAYLDFEAFSAFNAAINDIVMKSLKTELYLPAEVLNFEVSFTFFSQTLGGEQVHNLVERPPKKTRGRALRHIDKEEKEKEKKKTSESMDDVVTRVADDVVGEDERIGGDESVADRMLTVRMQMIAHFHVTSSVADDLLVKPDKEILDNAVRKVFHNQAMMNAVVARLRGSGAIQYARLSQITLIRFNYPPTRTPTDQPTFLPTASPTVLHSTSPSGMPTTVPSPWPTVTPTKKPTNLPSTNPTIAPSKSPTNSPSSMPSLEPSNGPSESPSLAPSSDPSSEPTHLPSVSPTSAPSKHPTRSPTRSPSNQPTHPPSGSPTSTPSKHPTHAPTRSPSSVPSLLPTMQPTNSPSFYPTSSPTRVPSFLPTMQPTNSPSFYPTSSPTRLPSVQPTSLSLKQSEDIWEFSDGKTKPSATESDTPTPTTNPSESPSSKTPTYAPSAANSGLPTSSKLFPDNKVDAPEACFAAWHPNCQDNPVYRSQIIVDAKCENYREIDCFGFLSIGYSQQAVSELVLNCPCSCRAECGKYGMIGVAPSKTTATPTALPTKETASPTAPLTQQPSSLLTTSPSVPPTNGPTNKPTEEPTSQPSSLKPTKGPTGEPTEEPTSQLSLEPTKASVTTVPTIASGILTSKPTTSKSTDRPSTISTFASTEIPTTFPVKESNTPTSSPTLAPNALSGQPQHTSTPTSIPSHMPNIGNVIQDDVVEQGIEESEQMDPEESDVHVPAGKGSNKSEKKKKKKGSKMDGSASNRKPHDDSLGGTPIIAGVAESPEANIGLRGGQTKGASIMTGFLTVFGIGFFILGVLYLKKNWLDADLPLSIKCEEDNGNNDSSAPVSRICAVSNGGGNILESRSELSEISNSSDERSIKSMLMKYARSFVSSTSNVPPKLDGGEAESIDSGRSGKEMTLQKSLSIRDTVDIAALLSTAELAEEKPQDMMTIQSMSFDSNSSFNHVNISESIIYGETKDSSAHS